MRFIRRGRTVAALLGAVVLALAGSPPVGATTDTVPSSPTVTGPISTDLDIAGFRDLAIDPATGRVFVAGGDKVTVLTPAGAIITALDLPGAAGLAVEGSALWVTQVNEDLVSRVDLSSLSVAQTYIIGTTVGSSIVVVGGVVWFTGDHDSLEADLLRLDPTTGAVTNRGGAVPEGRVVEIPGSTTHVIIHDTEVDPMSVYRVDISGPSVELEDDIEHGLGSNLREVVVTDDQTFITAAGSPYEFPEFRLSDMEQTGVVHEGLHYPGGIAYTPASGGVIVGSTASSRKAFVHRSGYPSAAYTITAPQEIENLGVEIAPDASHFYLVVEGSQGPDLLTYEFVADCLLRGPFLDVPATHVFCEDVLWLVDAEITGGYPDGSFRPGARLSREEMAAFLYRLAGEPAFVPGSPSFSDVPASSGFFLEVEWLAAEGVTGGYPNGSFRPEGSVSRQEMAAFLYRSAGEPAFVPGSPSFTDVPASHAFFLEIEWLAAEGVTGGYPDGSFRPAGSVARQETATFLHEFAEA